MSVWFKSGGRKIWRVAALVLVLAAGLANAQTSPLPMVAVELYDADKQIWHPLLAEVAMTPATRQRGLMHRRHLADDQGMLFIFPESQPLAFWMKNTYISLDIMYFTGAGRWVNTRAHTPPLSEETQPSTAPAQFVLEMVAGSGKRLGVGRGSRLRILDCASLAISPTSAICRR